MSYTSAVMDGNALDTAPTAPDAPPAPYCKPVFFLEKDVHAVSSSESYFTNVELTRTRRTQRCARVKQAERRKAEPNQQLRCTMVTCDTDGGTGTETPPPCWGSRRMRRRRILMRAGLGLDNDQSGLAIFDVYKAHTRSAGKAKAVNIKPVFVPASCTCELQPLDSDGCVNDALKKDLTQSVTDFYAQTLAKALEEGSAIEDVKVDLWLSAIQLLHASWFWGTGDKNKEDGGGGTVRNREGEEKVVRGAGDGESSMEVIVEMTPILFASGIQIKKMQAELHCAEQQTQSLQESLAAKQLHGGRLMSWSRT
ncbi:Hypp701 [Branchiostoma lanceolatum]|uniref:Hypp701 protein n=1 Tax=Branchiostoma lanceolatum TaxID=7740 RepID=A0A8J9YLS6_BRALA|nr:Hypp701 [Branchiostoma lanceolatum]